MFNENFICFISVASLEAKETKMTRIAFLGLGAMGRRMAMRLLKAGHDVTVWNRTPAACDVLIAAGAAPADTPAAAARGAEVVMAMLRDDPASRLVWLSAEDGALSAMADGAVAVECSTLTPGWVRALAADCARRGIAFSDSPVAGSLPQAEAGQLHFLSGGTDTVLDRIEPILRAMGAGLHRGGAAGAGTVLKLMVNAFYGVQVAVLAEIHGVLRQTDLDPEAAVETLAALPVTSPASAMAMKSMLSDTFPSAFPVHLVDKDFGYVVAAAAALGTPMPVAGAASGVFRQAVSRGFGADNITGVVQLYRAGGPFNSTVLPSGSSI